MGIPTAPLPKEWPCEGKPLRQLPCTTDTGRGVWPGQWEGMAGGDIPLCSPPLFTPLSDENAFLMVGVSSEAFMEYSYTLGTHQEFNNWHFLCIHSTSNLPKTLLGADTGVYQKIYLLQELPF